MFDWLEATPFGETLTWFEVIVSVAGLGGGGYIGGKTAVMARVRAEVRRELVAEHLPRLRAIRMADYLGEDHGGVERGADRVTYLVDVLSWSERHAWHRTRDRLEDIYDSVSWVERDLGGESISMPSSSDREQQEVADLVSHFASYVSWRLRPNLMRRFKRVRFTWGYVFQGLPTGPAPDWQGARNR